MFDARQLRRWGIREDDLPPGSIVRYREPTVWDLYKWYILGAMFLLVVETLFIAVPAQAAGNGRNGSNDRWTTACGSRC